MYTSKHRIFLTEDKTEAVLEQDPRAAFLLVCAGGTVGNDVAVKYNLSRFDEPVPAQAEEANAEAKEETATEDKTEEKATPAAPENKMIAPQHTKHKR